jgi:glycosyltransferase involved in cell wall biosynthesis
VLVVQPGAELYGSDRMLAESVAGLVAAGCAVTVAVPFEGPLVQRLRDEGADVRVVRMPVLRKSILRPAGLATFLLDVARGLPAAWRLVRRAGDDGVYVNTVTLPLWLLLARGLRRRVLLHVHEAERSSPRVVRFLLALPAVLAHRVVVNSSYTRDVLVESMPRVAGRTVVVPNGVVGPREVVPPRELADQPLHVAYVGRLSPRKGPHVAVEALAELVRRGVDARLTVAGSVFPGYEWFEAELRERVSVLGLADRVDFLGFVDDVWAVYASADVVVMPSLLDEGFGNSAVEAVLAARPVVVSDASGMREAVAGYRCAQAVAPGDPRAWADALQCVVKEWADWAGAASADAREARRRHDPARYGAAVARLMTDDSGSTA